MVAASKQVLLLSLVSAVNTTSVLLRLNGLLLIQLINEKRKQQAVFANVLNNKKKILRRFLSARERKQRKKTNCWFKPGRTDIWWQNFVSGVTPDEFWKKNFRLDRHSFLEPLNVIGLHSSPDLTTPNKRALHADKKLAITLYFLKDTGSLNMTANTFGIPINTTSVLVFEVCLAIVEYLGPLYLHLPKQNMK